MSADAAMKLLAKPIVWTTWYRLIPYGVLVCNAPSIYTPFRDTRKFKTELHGARGLAISLVVLFHIFGQGRVSGGIDIFLAITGFLAIPSLARRARAGYGGWLIDIPQRIAGLSRRLIIPLVPMLAAVTVAVWIVLPLTGRAQALREIRASALFYENWELINSQLSYDAAGPLTSPLQHLWSTSIQGQFHLVMIAFVIAIAALATLLRQRAHMEYLLIGALAIITVASFFWAYHETGSDQARAYFSTLSRAWQLTGPGILGLTITRLRISSLTRAVMSWTGVAFIVTCPMLLDGAADFPGPRALWPIAGICLVLAAGDTRMPWGADRLLATAPFQRIGDISYSLYLWHWPVLILTMAALGITSVTLPIAALVLAVSLALGTFGYRVFEQAALRTAPLSRSYLPAAIGASAVLAVAAMTTVGVGKTEREINAELAGQLSPGAMAALNGEIDPDYPGAAIYHGFPTPASSPIKPSQDIRELDKPWQYYEHDSSECISRGDSVEASICTLDKDARGPLVVMLGGSHVGQWGDALAGIAVENGWNLITIERSGCLYTADPFGTQGGNDLSEDCATWNANARERVLELHPDLVVLQGTTRLSAGDGYELATPGMLEAIGDLNANGISTFVLRETTTAEHAMAECVKGNDEHVRECFDERWRFYEPKYDGISAADLGLAPDMAYFFDTSPYLCEGERCFAEIGNVRTHRDFDHITARLSHTIAPYLRDELRAFRPDLIGR